MKEDKNFKRLVTVMIAVAMCLVVLPPVSADIPTNMVAYWKFDEGIGSIAYDETANANDGILSGGKFGNALEFDGISDYVEVSDSDSLDITSSITLEAWIYRTKSNYWQGIVSKFKGDINQRSYLLYLDPFNKLRIFISDDGSQGSRVWVDSTETIPSNTWVHVAGTFDGSNPKLYINGVDKTGTSHDGVSDIFSGTAPVIIGDFTQAGPTHYYFGGKIDEVRISNFARTSFDIIQAPTDDSGTVALWHFDESVGTDAFDETTNDNDGTIVGASWAGPTWATGKIGNALKFDGVDDYVEVPDDDTLDISVAWTISIWLYWEGGDETYETIFCKEAPGLHPAYAAWVYNGKLYAGMTHMPGTSYADWVQDSTMGTIAKDTWTHVSLTFDGADLRLYIDGAYTDILYVGIVGYTNDDSLFFGIREGIRQEFKGLIDEVAIYNTALSAVDIAKLYCISNNFGFGYCDPPSLTYTGNLLFGDTDDLIIEATFKDSDGNGMSRYDIEFFVNDISEGSATPVDGVASINLGPMPVDVYEVYAKVNCLESDHVFIAVYNPSAGFVTGGGWIYSDTGAYVGDPDAEGKANFGFVSKYKKGQSTPDGNTEFQFKAGDLNFHSSDYEWLVITGGGKAMYKGTGTINGEGIYKFMITAWDGQINGGVDTFRIKIWEEDEFGDETITYDNGTDTQLGGGQIKIHQN